MYQVYTAVKVVDDELERHGQVGVVVSASPDGTPITVKFDDADSDGALSSEFTLDQIRGL
ncbi:hypothetical protein CLU90_0990 [Janthinobacterium sp. 67]|uniref:hypothetical protein n=1 Tax=Janthinobacterium sp. 67 TaxID=2035207 RepID=UPI000C25137D|nr:hypothetical protein [Janthinobacterium sp. 67]PJJ17810.1 hypothetical protein CLU90_0990 [Janthinobacterium sp. 67]